MEMLPGNGLHGMVQHESGPQYELRVVQQPREGRTLPRNQRAKGHTWPVDPPPVLELVCINQDPQQALYIHSPNWFCVAEIEKVAASDSPRSKSRDTGKLPLGGQTGSWSSSMHKVKGSADESDKREHGYFVFGDINIIEAGVYKLKFSLFEMQHDDFTYASLNQTTVSNSFPVHANKGETHASTKFSRLLSDAGIKVKLRAEATKRKPVKIDWSSRQSDSMNRQLQLAPMHGTTMAPPPMSGIRGRHNMSVDVSDRVQSLHTPLASMTPLQSPISPTYQNHIMTSQSPVFTHSPAAQNNTTTLSQEWPHANPYATYENLQYSPQNRVHVPEQFPQYQYPMMNPAIQATEAAQVHMPLVTNQGMYHQMTYQNNQPF